MVTADSGNALLFIEHQNLDSKENSVIHKVKARIDLLFEE